MYVNGGPRKEMHFQALMISRIQLYLNSAVSRLNWQSFILHLCAS